MRTNLGIYVISTDLFERHVHQLYALNDQEGLFQEVCVPHAMSVSVLGFIPDLILRVSMGALDSYTGYTIGHFDTAYLHIANIANASEVPQSQRFTSP